MEEILQLKPSMAAIEDKDGAMPLMFASNKGHKKVRTSLQRGGVLCDILVCVCVCLQVCEVLLEAGAEVNRKDKKYGWTALMHATHSK